MQADTKVKLNFLEVENSSDFIVYVSTIGDSRNYIECTVEKAADGKEYVCHINIANCNEYGSVRVKNNIYYFCATSFKQAFELCEEYLNNYLSDARNALRAVGKLC